jgi:hypothetical protein
VGSVFYRSGLIFYRRGVGLKPDGKPFEDFEARINAAVFPSLQVPMPSISISAETFPDKHVTWPLARVAIYFFCT